MSNVSTVISPATAATTAELNLDVTKVPAHLFCAPRLGASEVATVQISADGGATWVDYYLGGNLVQLDNTSTGLILEAKGLYQISKGVTVAAVGIYKTL